MIKSIALDIDGVIYSSEPFLHKAYTEAIKLFMKEQNISGYEVPSEKAILDNVGKTYRQIIKSLFPGISESSGTILRVYILNSLIAFIKQKKGILLPGVRSFLEKAREKGFLIGTGSNGSEIYCESVLATYNLSEFFNERKYVDFEKYLAKEDLLLFYINYYGILPEELLFIGDRETDVTAARKAKCSFIGVTGHGNPSELASVNKIVKNLGEILPYFESSFNEEELCLKKL